MVPAHDERSPGSTKTCYSKWIEALVSAAPMWRLQSWHLVLWANIWVKLGSAIVLRFLPYIILCFFWGETRLEKRLTDIRKSRHKLRGSRFGILHCHSTYFLAESLHQGTPGEMTFFGIGKHFGQRQGIYHNATAWWLVGNFRLARLEPNRKNVCAWVCLCVEILNRSKTSIVASFSAFRFQQGAHGHLDGMGQRRPIQVALQPCMQSFHSDGMWPTEELPCRFSTRITFYRRFYFPDLN